MSQALAIKQLLKHREAAAYMRISVKTLFALTKEGAVPKIKIRGSTRYERDDLDAYLNAAKTR